MGQRNEAEVGGDTRDITFAGSMSIMAIFQQSGGLSRLLALIAVNEDANDMMRVVDGCVWN
jgi:hypothetical protein